MNQEIMTVDEVAALLRVSERTVYKWAQQGEIPAAKFGSTWRFLRPQITLWIEQRFGQDPQPHPSAEVAEDLAAVWRPQDTLVVDAIEKVAMITALLNQLADHQHVRDHQALATAVFHRESLMSTGIGGGIGVPHARLAAVSQACVAVGLSRGPITGYEAIDGQPVHLVFLIAAGAGQHQQHLRLLNDIATVVRDHGLREAAFAAVDAAALHALLTEV